MKIKGILAIILMIIIMIFNMTAKSYAETVNSLEVVKESAETKYLENEQGYISKKILNSDSNLGEVTVEVKIANTKEKKEAKASDTEIMLVIDNSGSMDDKFEGKTRKEIVMTSAYNLVEKVFNYSKNIKVGIVDFDSKSELKAELSSDEQTILATLLEMKEGRTGGFTNIEKGVLQAEECYSANNVNKIMVILTDGMPNESVSSGNVNENTANTLNEIANKGISIISMLANDEDDDDVKEVFGSPQNPTVGKFYHIQDGDIEKIISENIAKDVIDLIPAPIDTIKVVDYFPSDITENFEFSYVDEPTKGTLDGTKINENTNTIEWKIDELNGGEDATLKYKLKLKDMNSEALIDKIISTNEKIVLTYNDSVNQNFEVVLEGGPQIKLIRNDDGSKSKDETVAPFNLSQTGESIAIVFSIVIVACFAVIRGRKIIKMKNIK